MRISVPPKSDLAVRVQFHAHAFLETGFDLHIPIVGGDLDVSNSTTLSRNNRQEGCHIRSAITSPTTFEVAIAPNNGLSIDCSVDRDQPVTRKNYAQASIAADCRVRGQCEVQL